MVTSIPYLLIHFRQPPLITATRKSDLHPPLQPNPILGFCTPTISDFSQFQAHMMLTPPHQSPCTLCIPYEEAPPDPIPVVAWLFFPHRLYSYLHFHAISTPLLIGLRLGCILLCVVRCSVLLPCRTCQTSICRLILLPDKIAPQQLSPSVLLTTGPQGLTQH